MAKKKRQKKRLGYKARNESGSAKYRRIIRQQGGDPDASKKIRG